MNGQQDFEVAGLIVGLQKGTQKTESSIQTYLYFCLVSTVSMVFLFKLIECERKASQLIHSDEQSGFINAFLRFVLVR